MIKFFVFLIFILLGAISPAVALDCAPFEINKENILKTDLIFEGKVIKAEDLGDNLDYSKMDRDASFEFKIDKIWKSNFDNGVIDTNNITIMRNVYWGDGFKKDPSYLVFANKNDDGKFYAPLCGATIQTKHAQDTKNKLTTILNKNEEENE